MVCLVYLRKTRVNSYFHLLQTLNGKTITLRLNYKNLLRNLSPFHNNFPPESND